MKSLSNAKYELQRTNPKTGFKETVIFTGSLKGKPKGYKVIKRVQ